MRPSTIVRALAAALVALTTTGLLAGSAASAAPPGNEPLEVASGNLVPDAASAWGSGAANGLYGITLGSSRTLVDETGVIGSFTTSNATFVVITATLAGETSVSQTVDLSVAGTAIDSGAVTADLSAYLGSQERPNNPAISMTFQFRDATSAVLDTVAFGPIGSTERGHATGFVHRTSELAVPTGTRSVLITATSDGQGTPWFDEVSLTLSAPVPVVDNDSPTTVVDQPITFNPAENDTAAGPATLVPGSVRLLDSAGEPATTMTTADGIYTVDTSTGDVTYTPNPGFIGTGEPITYRVTDSNGQSSTGSITVVVGDVIGVSMIYGPVAVSSILFVLFISAGAVLLLHRRTTPKGV